MRTAIVVCALAWVGCNSEAANPLGGADPVAKEPAKAAGPTASEAALRMARYKAKQEGLPCAAIAAGGEVAIGDFVFRFDPIAIADPETRLPWIPNITERTALSRKNRKALIVPFAAKNNSPIAVSSPFGMELYTPDGQTHDTWYYNKALWTKANGRVAELGRVAPDTWVKTAYVYDVDVAHSDGAIMYFALVTYERDRLGHRHRILHAHVVVDLGAPVPAEPIRGPS